MDNKLLILILFLIQSKYSKTLEVIMQAIAVSVVKQICKNILESFVSMYENHFDIIRNTNEKSTK